MKNTQPLVSRRTALRSLCVALAAGGFAMHSLTQGIAHAAAPNTAKTGANNNAKTKPADPARTLIVYYSRTGNTRAVAEQIRAQVGGELVEIQTVTPYPAEYRATTEQAKKELAEGYKPPLVTKIPDMSRYDTIFVGSPNWWSTMAPPMMTFLSEYDFSGKTLVPFMTHGGGGAGRSVADMGRLCPGAVVTEGFAVRDKGAARAHADVEAWLRRTGLKP